MDNHTHIDLITMTLPNGAFTGRNAFALMTDQAGFAEATLHTVGVQFVALVLATGERNRYRRRSECILTAKHTFTTTILVDFVYVVQTNFRWRRSHFMCWLRPWIWR